MTHKDVVRDLVNGLDLIVELHPVPVVAVAANHDVATNVGVEMNAIGEEEGEEDYYSIHEVNRLQLLPKEEVIQYYYSNGDVAGVDVDVEGVEVEMSAHLENFYVTHFHVIETVLLDDAALAHSLLNVIVQNQYYFPAAAAAAAAVDSCFHYAISPQVEVHMSYHSSHLLVMYHNYDHFDQRHFQKNFLI